MKIVSEPLPNDMPMCEVPLNRLAVVTKSTDSDDLGKIVQRISADMAITLGELNEFVKINEPDSRFRVRILPKGTVLEV